MQPWPEVFTHPIIGSPGCSLFSGLLNNVKYLIFSAKYFVYNLDVLDTNTGMLVSHSAAMI